MRGGNNMTPARFRWGILFIAVGILLLLNNAGYLDWDYWYELIIWWPLILIALGVEKIFMNSRLKFISYLAPLIMIAGMAYVAIDTGADSYGRSYFTSYTWDTEDKAEIKTIDALIEHDNVDLFVNRTGYELVSARFDRLTYKPDIDYEVIDSIAHFNIRTARHGHSGIIFRSDRHPYDWRFSFSDSKPLRLSCIGDNSELNLYLESIPVEYLKVDNDDGEIFLKIGNKMPLVNVQIDGYDNSLRVKLPDGCGVKVLGEKYGGYLEKLGFQKDEKSFMTTAYNSSETKVAFILPDELRHFSIDFY